MSRTYTVIIGLSLFVFVLVFLQSCKKNRKKPYGTNKSHHTGTDCMSCHNDKNNSTIAFTLAGTVLDEKRELIQPGAEIRLYTEFTEGELVATIYTDLLGNFYTSEKIDFSKGLYPRLIGSSSVDIVKRKKVGYVKGMRERVYTGNCNSCHGPGVEKLGID